VRQESYQWEDERFDDFVGIKYTITNIGTDVLEDVYLGFFADLDAGPRDKERYYLDDAGGSWFGVRCTDLGPAFVNMAYMYDADGDGGRTPGFMGVMFLGHTTDPLGLAAPRRVEMTTYAVFSGDGPCENGGDPTNDFQRYEVMSSHRIGRDSSIPRDYRMIVSTGPFPELSPGNTLVFYVGLVVGEGIDGLLENAAYAQCLFDGFWFDLDGNLMTGIDRREAPVHGPVQGVVIDECRPELSDPIDVPTGDLVWINNDCSMEAAFKEFCGYDEADSLVFRTGVAGRETRINWLYEMPLLVLNLLDIRPHSCPNPFNMRFFESPRCRKPKSWGVLPVAILGSDDFDVRLVDISSVRLEGVPPLRRGCRYRDVSRPVADRIGCECTSEGPDGYLDLSLRFRSMEIARALSLGGAPVPGEERILALTGKLIDGTSFLATDCVKFVGRRHRPDHVGGKPELGPASPNPFNPVTRVTYYLPESRYIRLEVYDVSGRLVEVLAEGIKPAGENVADWNACGVASGVYFYRLVAGNFIETKKFVLVK
ncbi:MAG: T9SS type A sorting domain-containing protein, partial [Candidatus Krumholzibacteria bacterium]|nr:T9SS type A sorting domain-containing protein [Candidatus Krumholzibacteria bacterium]